MAAAAIVLGLLQPRAFVWCQAEAGHAAIEELEAGCCGVPGAETRCAPDLAGGGSRDEGRRDGIESEACRDVLVESPAGLPLGGELCAVPVPALRRCAVDGAVCPQPDPAGSRSDDGVRVAAHSLALSTVIRV